MSNAHSVYPSTLVAARQAIGCVNPDRKYGLNRINAFVSGGGRKPRRVTEHVYVPHRAFGTHAYALSKRGATKLLALAPVATLHVDAVIWGIPSLNLYCVHPQLAHQVFADSTIGGTNGGIEQRLPNVVIDRYTRITLRWAFNEPVFIIPGLRIQLTIGRSLMLCVLGFAAAAATGSLSLLTAHSALTLAVFFLLRHMVQPVSAFEHAAAPERLSNGARHIQASA
jgi:hypothetical protein